MILQITLTPLEPYFLGGERVFSFKNNSAGPQSQLTRQNPYYIRSEELPSQSALFGVLRYLGIREPAADFHLTAADQKQIGGDGSFSLCETSRTFGKINRIFPLRLVHGNAELIAVPAGRSTEAEDGCKCVIKDAAHPREYTPYTSFYQLQTLTGKRLVPAEYNEKIWDNARFLDPRSKKIYGCLFSEHEQVGINRASGDDGYFKKVYIALENDFAFRFYADVADDFVFPDDRIVYLGQGKSAFSAAVRKADDYPQLCLDGVLPREAEINGETRPLYYLYAESDVYYSGNLSELRAGCSLMLAQSRNYRAFATDNSTRGLKRYRKSELLIRLIGAGALFVFADAGKRNEFLLGLENDPYYQNGQRAGFNHLIKIYE